MDVFRILGGHPLVGSIRVGGAKNAVLPIFASALLTRQRCTVRNVPDLSDVRFMAEVLTAVGARVENPEPGVWTIEAAEVSDLAPYDLVRKMRASICLLGAMVGRLGRARVSLPGGCVIGPRPIDLHLKGLRRLGCRVLIENGYIEVDGSAREGGTVFLGGRYGSTVTGTANLLMVAVLTPGQTRIDCAACEPEVVDLCRALTAMGARIEGAGSPTIVVHGREELGGFDHTVIPDRIEAGTFLIASCLVPGQMDVIGADPEHLGALIDKLDEAGVRVENVPGGLRAISRAPRNAVDVITLPHPGFPTDLQAQMGTLLALTPGISIVTERIYPNRFMHVPELQRMGADIAIEGSSAIVKGVESLSGAPVMASDLRASAALVLAAMAATGETWIQRVYHIDRGYEGIDRKLASLGASLERLPSSEMPSDLKAE